MGEACCQQEACLQNSSWQQQAPEAHSSAHRQRRDGRQLVLRLGVGQP